MNSDTSSNPIMLTVAEEGRNHDADIIALDRTSTNTMCAFNNNGVPNVNKFSPNKGAVLNNNNGSPTVDKLSFSPNNMGAVLNSNGMPNIEKFLQILQHNALPIHVRHMTQTAKNALQSNTTTQQHYCNNHTNTSSPSSSVTIPSTFQFCSSDDRSTISSMGSSGSCYNNGGRQSSEEWEPMPMNRPTTGESDSSSTLDDSSSSSTGDMIPTMESIRGMFDDDDIASSLLAGDGERQQEQQSSLPDGSTAGIGTYGPSHSTIAGRSVPLAVCAAPPNAAAASSPSSSSQNNARRFQPFQLEKWMERVEELKAFQKMNGHCMVPHTYPPNQQLSRWCKRQRRQYKLMERAQQQQAQASGGCSGSGSGRTSSKSTMTPHRAAFLEDLGFVWDCHEAAWGDKIRDLARYKKNYGHTFVPSSYRPNPQLGVWVKTQRQQYALYSKGRPNSITKERIEQLTRAGFAWDDSDCVSITVAAKTA